MGVSRLKYSLPIFSVILLIILLSIQLTFLHSLQIIFGAMYLFFLPGFIWSLVIWKKDEIDLMERLLVSIILSMVIIPTFMYLLSKVGVGINLANSLLVASGILVSGIIITYFAIYSKPNNYKNINSKRNSSE